MADVGAGHVRRVARHLLLWIVAAAVACSDVQPTEPNERVIPADDPDGSASPARFELSTLFVADTGASSGGWRIQAAMQPGVEDGVVREASDTLWLGGQPHLPDYVNRGYRRYRAELETTLDRAHERIVVQPPAVDGVAPPATIEFAGIGRLDGDTIRWTPGSDFAFHLGVPTTPPTPDPVSAYWTVSVTQDSTRLSLYGPGLPPDSITIPHRYFSASGSQIRAYL